MNIQHPNSNTEQLLIGEDDRSLHSAEPNSERIRGTRDGTEPVPPRNQEFQLEGHHLCVVRRITIVTRLARLGTANLPHAPLNGCALDSERRNPTSRRNFHRVAIGCPRNAAAKQARRRNAANDERRPTSKRTAIARATEALSALGRRRDAGDPA